MKLQYLTAIFVVLFPLAKAMDSTDLNSRNYADPTWLKIADDACKKECNQPNAICNPHDDSVGVKTCAVNCSCGKIATLPENTSCTALVAISYEDFESFPGKCAKEGCNKI